MTRGVYQLIHYGLRQSFDNDFAGRDIGAASSDLGKTYH
jgi:hypothetical protein